MAGAVALIVALADVGSQQAVEAPPAAPALAEYYYREAERLWGRHRYSEARAALKQSFEVEARARTLVAMAECDEINGFGGAAWREFREAALLARAESDDWLERFASARRTALEQRIDRVEIVLAADADIEGLTLRLDGVIVDRHLLGLAQALDPPLLAGGGHRLTASAAGHVTWEATLPTEHGRVTRVVVPRLASESSKRTRPDAEKGFRGTPDELGLSVTVGETALSYDDLGRGTDLHTYGVVNYQVSTPLNIFVSETWVNTNPPSGAPAADSAWSNPGVGAIFKIPVGETFSVSPRLDLYVPVGEGGGFAAPSDSKAQALFAGTALNPAAFSPNLLTVVPAVKLTYAGERATLFVRPAVTLGARVRESIATPDAAKFAVGVVGSASYSVVPTRVELFVNLYTGHEFTSSPAIRADSKARDYAFLEGGASFIVSSALVLTLSYGRFVLPPASRFDIHVVTLEVAVSF